MRILSINFSRNRNYGYKIRNDITNYCAMG